MNDRSDYDRCESCDNYANLQRDGFCVGCLWTPLTDGTYQRSGWTPKQNLTITTFCSNDKDKEQNRLW